MGSCLSLLQHHSLPTPPQPEKGYLWLVNAEQSVIRRDIPNQAEGFKMSEMCETTFSQIKSVS